MQKNDINQKINNTFTSSRHIDLIFQQQHSSSLQFIPPHMTVRHQLSDWGYQVLFHNKWKAKIAWKVIKTHSNVQNTALQMVSDNMPPFPLNMCLSHWSGLSHFLLMWGNRRARCILLQCIGEIEVRGNAITHHCQPCFHVGCLRGLIMSRSAYLYL